jgi:hypothetical protein
MDAHKLQLKIFVTRDSAGATPLEAFIPVFHAWIKPRTTSSIWGADASVFSTIASEERRRPPTG